MPQLPENVQIVKLFKNTYSIEYTVYNWEPTIEELIEVKNMLTRFINENMKNYGCHLKFSCYVRGEDIAFGAIFVTNKRQSTIMKDFCLECILDRH